MNLYNFQYFVVLSVLGWVGGLGGEVNIPRASRLPVEETTLPLTTNLQAEDGCT